MLINFSKTGKDGELTWHCYDWRRSWGRRSDTDRGWRPGLLFYMVWPCWSCMLLLSEGSLRCWACWRCWAGKNKNDRVKGCRCLKMVASSVAEISTAASIEDCWMFIKWKRCWGWCSSGVKVKMMTMAMEGCLTAAASPLFMFLYVFPSLSFLCCCLCYYWKTKTMVMEGCLTAAASPFVSVFFFFAFSLVFLSCVVVCAIIGRRRQRQRSR